MAIKCSIRETFISFKDLEIIATCINVNNPSLTVCAYARVGVFTLTRIAIISRSLKLVNVSLFEYCIGNGFVLRVLQLFLF